MHVAGARSSSRRAAIRDRVNWMAAAGRGVIASNAESGNNISTASVVGAIVGAIAIPATTAPRTLDTDRRGGHCLGDGGRPGGGVEGGTPSMLAALGFSDDLGQRARDSKLGGVLQRDHGRRVPLGMTLPGNRFLRCGGRAGKPGATTPATRRQTASTAAAAGEIAAINRRRRQPQHRRDSHRDHCTHQNVGQFVDVGAHAGHQLTAVQPDGCRCRPVGQAVIDLLPRCAGRAQGGVVGCQSLAVAQHATRDRERSYRHDRDGQVQHRAASARPG